MKLDQNYSKFGSILKRETLSMAPLSFTSKYQVLHSADPYPGYYCNEKEPADNGCKEFSYYLPFEYNAPVDEHLLCRISLEMQSELSVNICPSVIQMQGERIRSFRVKEIAPEQLLTVFEFLNQHNFKLHKKRSTKSFLAYIHLKAFFELRQIGDGMYENRDSKGLYYMGIPKNLDWTTFERLITYQKSNSKFKNFDGAIGSWVEKPSFIDFLRIYGAGLDLKQLKKIHEEFLTNMKKYIKQGILI
ncbi:MAG: hypothetical protein ABFS38_07940 [Bacteroidota bacterium]